MRTFYINEELQKARLEKRKKNMLAYSIPALFKKLMLLIGIITIILLFVYAHKHTSDDALNIMNHITSNYKGNFTIVSSETDNKGNTSYQIDDGKGILFHAYKRADYQSSYDQRFDDYEGYLAKKCALEYLEENHLENDARFSIIEEEYIINHVNLYCPRLIMKINQFSEIEDATKQMLAIYHGVYQKMQKRDYDPTFYLSIRSNDFDLAINHISYYERKLAIFEAKRNYINYAMKNKVSDNSISEEDVKTYWYPNSLKLYFNQHPVVEVSQTMFGTFKFNATSTYHTINKMYYINIPHIIKAIPNIENVNTAKNGLILSFDYHGKHYELDSRLDGLKELKLPYIVTISEFEKIFNAKITLDFENEKLYAEFQ